MSTSFVPFGPLIQLKIPSQFRTNNNVRKSLSVSARLDDNSRSTLDNSQVNLSVLRFTFGIPGLDESYLPRWIGYGFGSLILLNHFAGSNSVTDITPAQLRTEALGLSLAAFSIVLPYLGKFLKGATPMDQTTIPDGSEQIFVMSEDVSDTQKEDLAWATYVLLRNTNTIAVLTSIQGELCVRGYWNTPIGMSKTKTNLLDWFTQQIEKIGISDLKDTLYFPQISESELWEMLPKGTRSLLVQPVTQVPGQSNEMMQINDGFILLASTISYAYSEKDRAWIGALAIKVGGKSVYIAYSFSREILILPKARDSIFNKLLTNTTFNDQRAYTVDAFWNCKPEELELTKKISNMIKMVPGLDIAGSEAFRMKSSQKYRVLQKFLQAVHQVLQ
ncbi:hypothetical protein G4B88_001334 [Cannabis sativa]|uniref:Protein COFACTOR ASSEMBLY OF COMPLEX C SUBUNIT B CCB2, chloroplastic n=2 Tax=Cannabis sativa TaxID=3483 RepID=A0A7J6I106_CANSA|nr:hypothetical protein G4B88_001334 [Cannabis sativa]